MTDREQTRRELEQTVRKTTSHGLLHLANIGLALLTELDQAEARIEQLSEWYNAEDRKSRDLQARIAELESR